jgi:deoxyribose-phosphate aldolase
MPLSLETFASAVDHTLLDAAAAPADVDELCDAAGRHRFASVCIHPWWVARACAREDRVRVGTVVAFPAGLDSTTGKIATALQAIADGAAELDVVMAWSALIAGDEASVARDLHGFVAAIRDEGPGITVKVIVEAAELDEPQLRTACALVSECGADFAKTSTGTRGGARVADVAAMRAMLPPRVAIKASGGIRSMADAEALLDAGATRLGTSSAIDILPELDVRAVA